MATLSVGGQLVATNDTLSNAVQDNITRLGTVTTGTMNNTIGSSATFPAGHVINVQSYSTAAESNTTSSDLVATTLTDSITMTSASNKVMIIANVAGALKTAVNYFAAYSIYRGTTNLAAGGSDTVSNYDWMGYFSSGDAVQSGTNINMCYVDTPGAGTHTYTVYYGSSNGTNPAYFCVWGQTSQIILMEVVV